MRAALGSLAYHCRPQSCVGLTACKPLLQPGASLPHGVGCLRRNLLFSAVGIACISSSSRGRAGKLRRAVVTKESTSKHYPVGTPGKPWGQEERVDWLSRTSLQRSYRDEVVSKLEALKADFDVVKYGALPYDEKKYPLYALKTKSFGKTGKPVVLMTGGVHGYETSGVQGAILFLKNEALSYAENFDILVAPCVSPWGYETINRWNPNAVDPNRSFLPDGKSEEASFLMEMIASLDVKVLCHIDLHETTDTDESEFRPALAARDGVEYIPDTVPDGFYTVGDSEKPQDSFQTALIDSVRKVTHIAPPDAKGNIIGEPITQEGVINYPAKSLGLCMGFTGATYATTTEVYPNSPRVTDDICNLAQVAAVTGALDFIRERA